MKGGMRENAARTYLIDLIHSMLEALEFSKQLLLAARAPMARHMDASIFTYFCKLQTGQWSLTH